MDSAGTDATGVLEVTPAEVKRLLDTDAEVRLIDCRTPREHAIARIDGAALIPLGEFEARVGELAGDSGKKLVVYCHHGVRSLRAAAVLRRQGFADVASMAGGIDRWSVEVDASVPRY